jgi:hypothetical protein
MTKRGDYAVIPGTTEGAILAGELYGYDRVDPRDCYTAPEVYDLSPEEVEIGQELLGERGFRLELLRRR